MELLEFDFMRRALFATVCMAVLCPLIGIFLVLRRTAMTGDALAHSTLAGVTLGLAGGVNPVGASFVFTAAAALLIEVLRHYFQSFTDLVLTIVLALSVGLAITLISSGAVHANAESFLFGSLLTVTQTDLWVIGGLTGAALVLGGIFYHEILATAFDEEAARAAGVPVRLTACLFAVLTASAVASAVRISGVLVMSSMLTVPVATALQLRVGFKKTLTAAVLVSLVDALTGLWLSTVVDAAPGGVMALTSTAVLFAAVSWRMLRSRREVASRF